MPPQSPEHCMQCALLVACATVYVPRPSSQAYQVDVWIRMWHKCMECVESMYSFLLYRDGMQHE